MPQTKDTFLADFHIHSHYSRATSPDCVPEALDFWARRKGLGVIGTGDFTHPAWRQELRDKLEPAEDGLYRLKKEFLRPCDVLGNGRPGGGLSDADAQEAAGEAFQNAPRFMVTGEISSIYKKDGRVRKVHNLILLPGLDEADLLAARLEAIGNIHSDGRPILGLDCRDLLEIMLEACPRALLVPAHIWTPHFSVFGAYSGFDDITECFEDLTGHIVALETGLSSDPPMNWRLSALDRFTLISNSDAHSPAKLAREANVFATEMGYGPIVQALQDPGGGGFRGTIEFFPEEGKYHFDGHRACNVCQSPAQTIATGGRCPVCGRPLTVGVLHRVEDLADRPFGFEPPRARPFESLVPLPEVIAASTGMGSTGKKATALYEHLLRELGPELPILRTVPLSRIEDAAGALGGALSEGIRRLREGAVGLDPGYDGAYGTVHILDADEVRQFSGQLRLSLGEGPAPATPGAGQGGAALKDVAPSQEGIAPQEAAAPGGVPPREAAAAPASEGAPKRARKPAAGHNAAARAAAVPEGDAFADDAVQGLSAQQLLAVSSPARAIAVQAGPGTGKTRALVARIIHLIEDAGAAPDTITAVTFTNKAAREMRSRLERHFGARRAGGRRIVDAVHIGTFHGVALGLLREAGQTATVINEATAQLIAGEVIQGLGLKANARDVLRAISLRKSTGPGEGRPQGPSLPAGLFEAYNERLKEGNAMDFDDILLDAERLMEGQASARGPGQDGEDAAPQGQGQACFTHLLVDEFQDANPVQYRLMRGWGAGSESLFVIGDPNQAVYGFRGADAHCFEWLRRDYPGLYEVGLTENYRSTQAIVDAACPVIAGDPPRLEAQRPQGSPVRLVHAATPFAEALFVAREINRLVGGIDMLDSDAQHVASLRGFADIAVLYRTNRQAAILEECLRKEGIPSVVTGRDETLADPDLAKSLAFFQLLLHPADRVALTTCLDLLADCGPQAAAAVLESYEAKEKTLAALGAVLDECGDALPSDALKSLAGLIGRYGTTVRKAPPQKLIASWAAEPLISPNLGEWAERLSHMAVFHRTMEELLQTITLGQEGDVRRYGGKRYTRDAVSLMTLHAAKGLEFPVVFLCGVTEGLMPLRVAGDVAQEDEERRLLFVGMTRAEDELVLVNQGEPSPFLASVPAALLDIEHAPLSQKDKGSKQLSMW